MDAEVRVQREHESASLPDKGSGLSLKLDARLQDVGSKIA
jgi:hypothetical protein